MPGASTISEIPSMELGITRTTRYKAGLSIIGLIIVGCFALPTSLHAQFGGGGFGRSVGGVMIDTAGVVRTATIAEKQEFINTMRAELRGAQGDLDEAADLRMVSLKGLQEAVAKVLKSDKQLPEDILYLAGLTRIEYVFIDKESSDIILGGPAEPWKVAGDGSIVGEKTGASILHLEDLIVAIRSVEASRNGGISCSIEPTAEGRNRLEQLLKHMKLRPGQNPNVFEASMKRAFGPQQVKLTNIPADSRYAATMVAADYEMKRLAMGLVNSPVRELPSYLQMSRNAAHSAGSNPRWWMECSYDSLTRNEDGTAWRLSGQGVKTLTEDDVRAADGSLKGSGKSDRLAQNWANKMTENFDELSKKMPIFGDMQNLMDLTVVSALIVQEQLENKAGLQLAVLRDESALEPVSYDAPRTISPECSFIKGRSGWVLTASGGVAVNAFSVVQQQQKDDSVSDVHVAALDAKTDRWWWNR